MDNIGRTRAHGALAPSWRPGSNFGRASDMAYGNMFSVIFLLSAFIVMLTFGVSSAALELLMHYTSSGGSALEKFHPASYLAVVLLFVILGESAARPARYDRHHLTFLGIFFVFMSYLAIVRGKGALASTILDIYIAPIILLLALARLDRLSVRKIAGLYVWIAVINALLIIVDFTTHRYTLPASRFLTDEYSFFRPVGLTGHPTSAAAMCVYALFFVLTGAIRQQLRRPLTLLFLLACMLCKERTPLAMMGALILWNLVRPFSPRESKSDYLFDYGMVFLVPAIMAVAYLAGAFDRFLAIGIWEKSTESRFLIYQSLSLLSWDQFMFGLSYDVSTFMAEKTVDGEFVESSFVLLVFAAGLPFACVFLASVVAYFWPYMKANYLFAAFVLIALGTGNAFAAKNITPATLILLGYYLTWCAPIAQQETSGPRRIKPMPSMTERRAQIAGSNTYGTIG